MTASTKPKIYFWIVGIIALLWNLAGVSQFFAQAMNTENWRSNFTPEMLEIIDNLPLWYILIFAIAVFASTFASIFLLLKKKIAVPLFLIGLVAVTLQCLYNLFINEAKAYYGAGQIIITVFLPIFSLFLYYFSVTSQKRGWIT